MVYLGGKAGSLAHHEVYLLESYFPAIEAQVNQYFWVSFVIYEMGWDNIFFTVSDEKMRQFQCPTITSALQ